MGQQEYFRALRIGVCGSQRAPSDTFRAFATEVGRTLGAESEVVLALAGRRGDRGPSADECVAEGFRSAIHADELKHRAQTFYFANDTSPDKYFRVGKVIETSGSSREARRFAMVHAVDGLIGISGSRGTEQQLTFALATETPLLPVPVFGGRCRDVWNDHSHQLAQRLELTDEELATWVTEPKSIEAAKGLARTMVATFLNSIPRRCFVIMPFRSDHSALIDLVIDPAIRALGDEPIHLGRLEMPGDVGQQISQGIACADYIVCVLDDMRPNVLYELGRAHALGKPVVLMWQRNADEVKNAPFDIDQHQRVEYDAVDDTLKNRLVNVLQNFIRETGVRGWT